jgi:hypothetical protein
VQPIAEKGLNVIVIEFWFPRRSGDVERTTWKTEKWIAPDAYPSEKKMRLVAVTVLVTSAIWGVAWLSPVNPRGVVTAEGTECM